MLLINKPADEHIGATKSTLLAGLSTHAGHRYPALERAGFESAAVARTGLP